MVGLGLSRYTAQKRIEKRIARTGPSLPETLQLLAPLVSTLEFLDLSENKLGGTITPDIAAFAKLTGLGLSGMGLEGASLGTTRPTAQKRIDFTDLLGFAQAFSRRHSASSPTCNTLT